MTDAAPAPTAAPAEPAHKFRTVSEDCWKIISALRLHGWRATALELAGAVPLGYRGRISDLRRNFLLNIQAEPKHPAPGTCATYFVLKHQIPRAEWLWANRSLSGYAEAPRQLTIGEQPQ